MSIFRALADLCDAVALAARNRETDYGIDAVKVELARLRRRSRTSIYYWRNGVIREGWLHPTKGWRWRRHSTRPLVVADKTYLGEIW